MLLGFAPWEEVVEVVLGFALRAPSVAAPALGAEVTMVAATPLAEPEAAAE